MQGGRRGEGREGREAHGARVRAGGKGGSRTHDTGIFSPLLYH